MSGESPPLKRGNPAIREEPQGDEVSKQLPSNCPLAIGREVVVWRSGP
jgi:hypothetical protein